MEIHQNTFTGGLDTDTSLLKISNDKYISSTNFRVIMDGENRSGAICNTEGNKILLRFIKESRNSSIRLIGITILGMKELDKDLIVFTHDIVRNSTSILQIPKAHINSLSSVEEINVDNIKQPFIKLFRKNFGFSRYSRLRIVANKENELISKIYFTDGVQPLRVVNLKDDKIGSYAVTQFEILPNVILNSPKFNQLTSGSLKAGRVQYAYQLYNVNGSETTFSPTSNLIDITTSTDTSFDGGIVASFKGTEAGEVTNKGVTLSIENIDTRFEKIKIVRILHEAIDVPPSISVFFEVSVPGDGNLTITDTGNIVLEEYTIEEFNELLINPKPKTLEVKNNYLFLGNLQEDTFDFNYDASARRYNLVEETYPKFTKNPFNNVKDVSTDNSFKYDLSGELGGEGDNISYKFTTKKVLIDKSELNVALPEPYEVKKHVDSLVNLSKYVGYQRDEIYRFGLVGFNRKMQPSPVKWIDDIRFPDILDVELEKTIELIKENISPKVYFLRFAVSSPFSFSEDDQGKTLSVSFNLNFSKEGFKDEVRTITFTYYESYWEPLDLTNPVEIELNVNTFNNNKPYDTVSIIMVPVENTNNNNISIRVFDTTGDFNLSVATPDSDVLTLEITRIQEYAKEEFTTTETVSANYDLLTYEEEEKYTPFSEGKIKERRVYANVLGIQFRVKNLPSDIVAYQIVRVERDRSNRTVIDMGMVGELSTATVGLRFSENLIFKRTTKYAEYTSPEQVYNKIYGLQGDEIQYLYNTSQVKSTNLYTGAAEIIKVNLGDSINTSGVLSGVSRILYSSNHIHSDNLEALSPFNNTTVSNNIAASNKVRNRTRGSCKLLELDTSVMSRSAIPEPSFAPIIARRRNLIYPYGGFNSSSLEASVYIPCSNMQIRTQSGNFSEDYMDVFNGDTFIHYFHYLRLLWNDTIEEHKNRGIQFYNIPVESSINLGLVLEDNFNSKKYADTVVMGVFGTPAYRKVPREIAMKESVGVWQIDEDNFYEQTFDLYRYNSAYSSSNRAKRYFPKPDIIRTVTDFPVNIRYSDRKVPGEIIDSWMKFRPKNYKALDGKYGSLVRLYNFKDNLFFFQNTGVGILGVEQRELIQTSTPGPLVAGLGDVISQPYYLVTNSGINWHNAVTNSNNAIYYIDLINRKLARVVEKGIEYLSDVLNISSLLQNEPFNRPRPLILFDSKFNEVYFCLNNTDTLIYNEYLNKFTGKYTTTHTDSVVLDNKLFTARNLVEGITNELAVNYFKNSRSWYNVPIESSLLKIVINPQSNFVCVYDILEFTLEMLNKNGENVNNSFFHSLRLQNEYQDTGWIDLVPEENIVQRFRTWRFNGTFDSITEDARLRSSYIILSIKFTSSVEKNKMILHDILTKYRVNKKR
jgi:hypothetical protein